LTTQRRCEEFDSLEFGMFLQKPSHVEYKMDRAAHNPAHDTKKHACCSVTDYVNQSAGQQKFADLKIPQE